MKVRGLQIGDVILDAPIIFAPMAGVSDLPYRQILTRFEPGMICGEMVSAKGLVYGDAKTSQMVSHHGNQIPYSQQIFGSELDIMAQAALIVEELGADVIDINMGCPAPKIVKNGDGAALLEKPELAEKIVRAVVKAVSLPVTVKIRKAFKGDREITLDLALRMQEQGASAITIHGRTREQQYSGTVDWQIIANLSCRLDIPTIGNGDIVDPEHVQKAFDQTECDGVMIGRGVMGNPWLISRSREKVLEGRNKPLPNCQDVKEVLMRHFRLAINHYGENRGVKEMRKHFSWYLKGLPNSTKVKNMIMTETDPGVIIQVLSQYFDDISPAYSNKQ